MTRPQKGRVITLQHNCRKTYAVTTAALEAELRLGVGLVCLQEPYISKDFRHGRYQTHWPEAGAHKNRRAAVAIRRDLFNRVMVEAQTDLVNHPYIIALDIWELGRSGESTLTFIAIPSDDVRLADGYCRSFRIPFSISPTEPSRPVSG
jgi:hypothetical protein